MTSLLLIATASLLAACSKQETPNAPPRVVLVQPAAVSDQATAVYSGEIRARHEFDLAFRVGGKIAARLVDAGAEVKPGQVLARLDPADLQLAASAAAAQLSSAESDYKTAAAERERYAGLRTRNFVSQAAFETRDNALNAAQARLEQARAQTRLSNNQAAYGSLSSDHPAIVTAVLAEAGQVVSAGQPVLRLARPEQKEIAIAVPESRLVELKAAKTFTVGLWAEPKTQVRAELRELAAAADPQTRSYAARIRLLDPPPQIQLGMTARVRIDAIAAAPADELTVPLPAVIDLGQGPVVRVVDAGKVVSRPVSITRFDDHGAHIASGLSPGELVIVAGAGRLAEGEVVHTKPLTPAAQQR